METITITLNGIEVGGYPGMTVLELAKESGIYIPTLCHDQNLVPTGACRLCLVENESNGALLAACVTPLTSGMVLQTDSPRVLEHRKKILKLLLSSHPDTCMVCDKGNCCELRTMAAEMGIGSLEYQKIPQMHSFQEINPFIERDISRCILCGKCIRADQEMVVIGAIDYVDRGTGARPSTWGDLPLEKSECTFCGTCVAICPTGALMDKDRTYSGTATSHTTSVCPYCGCGCTLDLGFSNGKVICVRPDKNSPVNRGTACVLGSYGCDFVHHPERLKTPLIKIDGEFQPAGWDDALARIAAEFNKIITGYGPDALGFFGNSKGTNEENYLFQRFARSIIGTNNIDNGSRLYNAASQAGLGSSLGYVGTTGSIDVLARARSIIVIGANPDITAPIVSYAIRRAVKFRGAHLTVIDPRQTPLTQFASYWLRPHIGTDIALLNAMAKTIIDARKLDFEFVTRSTHNFSQWLESLENQGPDYAEKITGISQEMIKEVACKFAEAEEAVIVYGNGITQQIDGTGAVIAIANLAMLTGNVDRRGGIFALQKDNNAQGANDLGVLPGFLPGYQSVSDTAERHRFETCWGTLLPDKSGLTIMEMIKAADEGKLHGMFIMGENPAIILPRPSQIKRVLASLDFLVVSNMFMTETAQLADIVLPSASFVEKNGTFTNFEGRVQKIQSGTLSYGDSLPEDELILRLAKSFVKPLPYTSLQEVGDEIKQMVPFYPHIDYEHSIAQSKETIDSADDNLAPRRLHKGMFPLNFGRFSTVEYQPDLNQASAAYPFTLMTGSVRYHAGGSSPDPYSMRLSRFNTGVTLEISQSDASNLGIIDGDDLKVSSQFGEFTSKVRISPALPPGLLFMPNNVPHSPVLDLFDTILNKQTGALALKTCSIKVEKVKHAE